MEAVFFDIDETLLSEKPLIMLFLPQVYDMLSKKLGISRGDARLKFLREISEKKDTYEWHDWNFFFEIFGLDFRYEELLRQYPHKIHVFPDVKPTLEWLREEGYKLGVITSGPEYQKLKLRITKLDKYFDVIVIREDVKTVKPDPKIFLYACEKLNVEPEESIMIGDNLHQDVYGAKNVGMLAVWINREGVEDYNFADFEIRSLHQLRTILGGSKMREIFNKEGVFVKYEEKVIELENGDKLTHRRESPTELWWLLKEAIKGKKVKIIAYEIEE